MEAASITPKKQTKLTRDQRIEVITLREVGWKYEDIAQHLDITIRQVQYACTAGRPTPQKSRCGKKSIISDEARQILINFVCASSKNRRMPFHQIAWELDWNVSANAIRQALKREEYSRHIARRKPPLSEINRLRRLEGAMEHVSWTKEQGMIILGSDETWVNGSHGRVGVTRRADEELEPTCIVPKYSRRGEGMFGACFASCIKGPCLFWEKDWGTINQQSYCERVVPIIHGWIRMNPHLLFMQDNAPGHAAQATIDELAERDISTIYGPAYSPDLNPIEAVWNLMKNGIQLHYEDEDKLSYDRLRQTVKEAGDVITSDQLDRLIDSMSDRCQAVIDAQRRHTKYGIKSFYWWFIPVFH